MENYKNPNIRFKGFTDPWEQRKFEDVTFLSGEKNKNNLPFESYSVTNENGFVPQNEQFENGGTMATADKRMYYIVSKNSFAYNPARINVGSIGYYDGSENVIVSSLYEVFKTSEDIDDRYLWHWFKSNNFKKLIEQYQEGGVRLYFYYDKLCMCSLPTPSIQEQVKIGRYFDNLDNLITLHQRKYSKLLNVKESMLEKMFPKNGSNIPEIRFKGFTDPWEQRKLKETIEYIVDNRGKNPDYYCSEGIPVIDNFMIRNSLYPDLNTATRFIDENLYQNFIRKYNEEDDILLTLVGNGIGNITLFPKDKAVIIQNTLGFRAKVDKKFLFFLLMANNEALVKLDRGMAQPSIRQDEILDFDIYVPSNSEQTQIGEYFSNLDNLITLHQRELEKLQNIKKSMLEKMFV